MLRNLQVTALMLFTPLLAFLSPLFVLIGKAAFFTNVYCLLVFLYLFDHLLPPAVGRIVAFALLSRRYLRVLIKSTRSSKSCSDILQRGIASSSGLPAGSMLLMIALFNVSSV